MREVTLPLSVSQDLQVLSATLAPIAAGLTLTSAASRSSFACFVVAIHDRPPNLENPETNQIRGGKKL